MCDYADDDLIVETRLCFICSVLIMDHDEPRHDRYIAMISIIKSIGGEISKECS